MEGFLYRDGIDRGARVRIHVVQLSKLAVMKFAPVVFGSARKSASAEPGGLSDERGAYASRSILFCKQLRTVQKFFSCTVDLLPARSSINVTNEQGDVLMDSKPTYEQAQLHLTIFEQRREARLREARDWFFKNYHPESMEESMRIAAPMTENGNKVMMVFSYWDQACAFLNHGLLNEELFFETTGEFFGVWERVAPIVEEGRKMFVNPLFLGNLEKAAKRFETWIEKRAPGHVAAMRAWTKQLRGAAKSAA
jgi:hypothetical protein